MLNTQSTPMPILRTSAINNQLLLKAEQLKQVSLVDQSFKGKFILWGDIKNSDFNQQILDATGLTLPLKSGDVSQSGDYLAIWANPKRWYLICTEQHESELAKKLIDSGQVHMSVTDGQCCFHLNGLRSIDLLKKGCSLNFDEAIFPSGKCLQTRLAITKVFLHRHALDSFDIYVERSYGEYIWRWLLDAAQEYAG